MANDIEKVRAQAHDANVANKIIDSLKELQQSSDEKSRCRWVWELIQNAKDVANSSGSVDVKISFNEQQRILQFAHNGKPFSMQNIVFLIEQVSTKDRDEKYELIKTCFDLGGKPYIKICCPCCDNLTEGSYQVITDIPKKLYLKNRCETSVGGLNE